MASTGRSLSGDQFDTGTRTLAFVVGMFGLAGSLAYAPRLYRAIEISRWRATTATVVDEQVHEELAGVTLFHRSTAQRYEDRLRVQYSYSVSGTRYTSGSIGPFAAYVPYSAHRESTYAVGSRLPARYDPSQPGDAVLEAPSLIGTLMSSFIWAAAALWSLSRGVRSRSRSLRKLRALGS
jgi:hypothetical protein